MLDREHCKQLRRLTATQCYVATNLLLAKTSGEYFKDCNPAPQGEHQRDAAMAAKLSEISTQLTLKYLV